MSNPEVTERVARVDLDQAETTAQRMLDGMTVNRDRMARDHAAMARELRLWREKYAEIAGKAHA